jgi:hypothetical protein
MSANLKRGDRVALVENPKIIGTLWDSPGENVRDSVYVQWDSGDLYPNGDPELVLETTGDVKPATN